MLVQNPLDSSAATLCLHTILIWRRFIHVPHSHLPGPGERRDLAPLSSPCRPRSIILRTFPTSANVAVKREPALRREFYSEPPVIIPALLTGIHHPFSPSPGDADPFVVLRPTSPRNVRGLRVPDFIPSETGFMREVGTCVLFRVL